MESHQSIARALNRLRVCRNERIHMMTNFIQSLQKKEISTELIKRHFQPGQIFHGKIMKLFPNQIAEVQVGNQKLIANLEVPLAAGERYWFQVLSAEGKPHLKVLPMNDNGNNQSASFVDILKQMSLSGTKENLDLLNFFIKEQLPLSKETFHSAISLLRDTNFNKENMSVVKEMLLRNLPLTKDVFSSFYLKNEPLYKLMQNLQTQLSGASMDKTSKSLLSFLNDLTMTGKDKINERVLSQLMVNGQNSKAEGDAAISRSILQKLGMMEHQHLESITGKQAEEITLTSNTRHLNTPDGIMPKINNFNISTLKFDSLNEQETSFLNRVIEEVQIEEVAKWENGKQVADHLRNLVAKLGLDYESRILQFIKEGNQLDGQKLEVLKATLIQFLNGESPSLLKDAAEQILHKITGIQLQSQESGPIQQYVVQIPLSFWDKTTDLTIQWNGRKKENGQIDPDYCRILFYLELEYLNEIIVDLQIQNRIMNIRIINDVEEIKMLAAPFMENLKDNLDKLGFKLSNVVFQSTSEQAAQTQKKASQQYYHSSQYNGVDIRI